jgi:hypothetical protein
MDGFGASSARGVEQPISIEIALARIGRPEMDGHVGERDVEGSAIRIGIDGHASYVELAAGA